MATHESLTRYVGNRSGRKSERGVETRILRNSDGSVSVQYHWTNVVTYLDATHVMLNSGGWHTSTTRDRMNTYSPDYYETAPGQCSYRVYMKQYALRVSVVRRRTPTEDNQSSWETIHDMPMRDGMVIDLETGEVADKVAA